MGYVAFERFHQTVDMKANPSNVWIAIARLIIRLMVWLIYNLTETFWRMHLVIWLAPKQISLMDIKLDPVEFEHLIAKFITMKVATQQSRVNLK